MILRFLDWLDKWFHGRRETISGRLYRRQATHDCAGCKWLCKMLDKIDRGHCRKAYFADRIRNPNLPWI